MRCIYWTPFINLVCMGPGLKLLTMVVVTAQVVEATHCYKLPWEYPQTQPSFDLDCHQSLPQFLVDPQLGFWANAGDHPKYGGNKSMVWQCLTHIETNNHMKKSTSWEAEKRFHLRILEAHLLQHLQQKMSQLLRLGLSTQPQKDCNLRSSYNLKAGATPMKKNANSNRSCGNTLRRV